MSQVQSEMIFNLLKRQFVQTPEIELRKLADKAQKLKPSKTVPFVKSTRDLSGCGL